MGRFNFDKKSLIIGVLSGALAFNVVYDVTTNSNSEIASKSANIFSEANVKTTNSSNKNNLKTTAAVNDQSNTPVVNIAKEVGPAVVGVVVKTTAQDYFGQTTEESGSGSGIIFNKDGYIVTNNHVVTADSDTVADDIEVYLHVDGKEKQKFKAKLIGRDPQTDIAVIKIDPPKDTELTVAQFGDSSNVKVGELAVAIGNPLGEEFAGTVTSGVISALNRKVTLDDKEFNLIQTDAAINQGNSGGALVNASGEVIGINSVKLSEEGVEGMGFAIPINQVKTIIKDLVSKGKVDRAQLGIYTADDQSMQEFVDEFDVPNGVYVTKVVKDSGADKGGIKEKDIITKIGDKKISTLSELRNALADRKIGDTVEITVYRGGKTVKLSVKLVEFKE